MNVRVKKSVIDARNDIEDYRTRVGVVRGGHTGETVSVLWDKSFSSVWKFDDLEIVPEILPENLLSPTQITDAAWSIPYLESYVRSLKLMLCEESFLLRSYTPASSRKVSRDKLQVLLLDVIRAVKQIAVDSDIAPRELP